LNFSWDFDLDFNNLFAFFLDDLHSVDNSFDWNDLFNDLFNNSVNLVVNVFNNFNLLDSFLDDWNLD
jgi:hypothetical protein